jgi:hypothetical protein
MANHPSLEFALPHYSTLTLGDTIELVHNGQTHLLNVLEIQPASAVSLVAEPYLDIKIEFAQAIDYREEDVKSGMRAFEAPSSGTIDKKPADTSGQALGTNNNNSTTNTASDASTQICSNWYVLLQYESRFHALFFKHKIFVFFTIPNVASSPAKRRYRATCLECTRTLVVG